MAEQQGSAASGAESTFALPDVGEGLTEAEVLRWHVGVGDTVAVNDVLLEIETAKSVVELPSPFAGVISDVLVGEDITVPVGTPLVRIATGQPAYGAAEPSPSEEAGPPEDGVPEDEAPPVLVGYGPTRATRPHRRRARREPAATQAVHGAFAAAPEMPPTSLEMPPSPAPTPTPSHPTAGADLPSVGGFGPARPSAPPPLPARPRATPPVRRLARELRVDLSGVVGTGPGGLISRDDVRVAALGGAADGDQGHPRAALGGTGRHLARSARVPVRSLRRATADAVTRSAFTAPHVTEFLSVDASAGVALLQRLPASSDDAAGAAARPTILTLVARAMVLAVDRTPEVNAHWEDGSEPGQAAIVHAAAVHLGVATSTERGLIVPVVRDAERLGLHGLAAAISAVVQRTRAGRAGPEDTTGGTVSVTNVGTFGVDSGTPIIVPGQSAILALGRLARRPWVLPEDEHGPERVAARWVLPLALSFDHRVLDGRGASRFLTDVGMLVSDPALAIGW